MKSFEGYKELERILEMALVQAAEGKGKDRHACDLPFDEQPIIKIQEFVGSGFATGQAMKKIQESTRMPKDRKVTELLGAIVYLAGAICYIEKEED